MHGEQGADFLAARFRNTEIAASEVITTKQLMQGTGKVRDFPFVQETGLEQKAPTFKLIQLRPAQWSVLGPALDHRLATAQPRQVRATRQASGVWIIPPSVDLGGAGLRLR
ncbi:hypothetical protein Y5W_00167 [Alcanivorax sp. 521-1]|uniref:Uncharacterized protein n=1 Tax=Alloalcanivorax profundimaris TaxID=2735259 RepID=A0ABS0AL76_9GAMM|nr:hypothetical protein [Alloalcanivorax profundimaris]